MSLLYTITTDLTITTTLRCVKSRNCASSPNYYTTNGCILGGLCSWFVPLLRFLCTRLVGWNLLKPTLNKVKNCVKHSSYMLAIAICPSFTITISSIDFSCVLFKSNFRSVSLISSHRGFHLGFKKAKFTMTAGIILDILDMACFKKGISLPFAFKSSSPFLSFF